MYSVSNESDHKKKFKFVKKYKSTLVEKPTQKNNNPDEYFDGLLKLIQENDKKVLAVGEFGLGNSILNILKF